MTTEQTPEEYHLWGQTRRLYLDSESELVRAIGGRGGRSSMHLHRHKSSTFVVLSGDIEIREYESDLRIGKSNRLSAGQSLIVPAGVKHRVVIVTDCVFYELYVVDGYGDESIDPADIVRFDEGSPHASVC